MSYVHIKRQFLSNFPVSYFFMGDTDKPKIILEEVLSQVGDIRSVGNIYVKYREQASVWEVHVVGHNSQHKEGGWLKWDVIDEIEELEPEGKRMRTNGEAPHLIAKFDQERIQAR